MTETEVRQAIALLQRAREVFAKDCPFQTKSMAYRWWLQDLGALMLLYPCFLL